MADQSEFLSTYGPLADDISAQTGLDRSVVLGHMAQETGFGKKVYGNNLFGISPGGKLASYPDAAAGAQAYVDLLKSPRYVGVLKATDPDSQALSLGVSGYGPTGDYTYGRKVMTLAKQLRPDSANIDMPITADDVLKQLKGTTQSSTQSSNTGTQSLTADDVLKSLAAPTTQAAQTPTQSPTTQVATAGLQPGPTVGTKVFPPEPPSRPSDALDMGQPPLQPGAPQPSSPSGVPGFNGQDLIDAAKRGYNNAPTLLAPPLQTFVDRTSIPGAIASHTVNGVLGGMGAAYNVAQEGVNQVGNSVSPGLGRDLAAGMDLIPAIQAEGHFGFGMNGANPPKLTQTQQDNMLGSQFKNDPMSSELAARGGKSSIGQGISEPNVWDRIKLTETNTPTADPSSAATKNFAELIKNQINSGMILSGQVGAGIGHLVGGAHGAAYGAILGPIAAKFGPKIAEAVGTALANSARVSPTGTANMLGSSNHTEHNGNDSTIFPSIPEIYRKMMGNKLGSQSTP